MLSDKSRKSLAEKKEIVVGVDVGGTNTVVAVTDLYNNILFQNEFKTEPEKGVENFFVRLSSLIKNEYENLKSRYIISGIGLAAPSANYLKGTIESPANLKWGNVNLVEMMRKHFDFPIKVLNDANAAAIGEHTFGAARGMNNFIVLTLGTGLGSGIFIDGHLLQGENGLAGELGHTNVEPDGRECTCGRDGCLETYVSANGLKRSVFYFLAISNELSELRDISFNELTGKKISDLARKNDPIALKAFSYTADILARALANTVTYFNPEAIILFGGLADSNELLLDPLNIYFEKYLLNIYKGKIKILKSELQNGKSAVLGACSYAKKTLGENLVAV
jgi:glucokinase